VKIVFHPEELIGGTGYRALERQCTDKLRFLAFLTTACNRATDILNREYPWYEWNWSFDWDEVRLPRVDEIVQPGELLRAWWTASTVAVRDAAEEWGLEV